MFVLFVAVWLIVWRNSWAVGLRSVIFFSIHEYLIPDSFWNRPPEVLHPKLFYFWFEICQIRVFICKIRQNCCLQNLLLRWLIFGRDFLLSSYYHNHFHSLAFSMVLNVKPVARRFGFRLATKKNFWPEFSTTTFSCAAVSWFFV